MSHEVVKFKTDDDGTTVHFDKWHLSVNSGGSKNKLCTGEVYGIGESAATFVSKIVSTNGVTCESCLTEIRYFKNLDIK